MAENYLDLEATAIQVKKGIEEIVGILTDNIRENNNKFIALELDEDGLPDDPTEDELLERTSLVLKTIEVESSEQKPIESALNEMLIGDGNNWTKKSNWFIREGVVEGTSFHDQIESTDSFIFGTKSANPAISSLIFSDGIDSDLTDFYDSNLFQIGEKSNFIIRNKSDVKIGRIVDSENLSPDYTRVHIFDGAKVDLDGGRSYGKYGSPEVYMHGNVKIHIGDGRNLGPNFDLNYTGNNPIGNWIKTPTVHMYDKAYLSMNQGSSIVASNTAQANFFAGVFRMETAKNPTDYVYSPCFSMTGRSSVLMNGDEIDGQPGPCLCMNGRGHIVFNAKNPANGSGWSMLDPYLLAEPTSFIFIGQGSSGTESGGTLTQTPCEIKKYFGGKSSLSPANKNPQIKIANESMIVIDTADNGANWIKISAGEDKLIELVLTGNIFQQMSGNAHSEIHDDSKLIMRGPLSEDKKAWEDGLGEQDNGHCGRDWRRPILPDNSPVFGMYDISQFAMRGVWDLDNIWNTRTTTFYISDWDTTLSTPKSMAEIPQEYLQQLANYNMNKVRDLVDENGNILTQFTVSGTTLEIYNFEYSTMPANWNEHIQKIEDQPVVEIIENADVRIYGNSELKLTNYSIIANSEGFTFKDNNTGDYEIFSMENLKQLKKLLENSTIN